MKCMSCDSEINPKWKHAVDTNLCPFCGKSIMDSDLKNLLSTLTSTIESLSENKSFLDDWLHTYGYVHESKIVVKKETAVKEAEVKNVTSNNDNEPTNDVGANLLQDPVRTNKFFKNAEVDKVVSKTQHLKEIVSQIKKSGTTSLASDSEEVISPDMLNNADPETVAELQEVLGGNMPVASSLSMDNEDEDIHPAALAMAQIAGGKGNSNARDLLKLQELRNKTSSARNRMLSGSSGKGSFSRS